MLAALDWNAIGATAAVVSVVIAVGAAVVKTVKNYLKGPRLETKRLDLLEIRLFGLPADKDTGAKKLDGEFDRIDKRFDELPGLITAAVRDAK